MNSCERYEELCSADLDGMLRKDEQAELQEHLAVCPECKAYWQALQEMQAQIQEEPNAIPEDLHESIMHTVMEEAKTTVIQTEKPHRRPPVFTMIAAAAAVVMLVLTGAIGDIISTGRDMLDVDGEGTTQPSVARETPADPAQPAPFSAELPTGEQPDGAAEQPDDAVAPKQAQPDKNAPEQGETTPSGGEGDTQDSPRAQIAPRMAAVDPDLRATPASLKDASFAFCYVATGTGELPNIAATYLDRSEDGQVAYYSIKNDMSVLEKALSDLSKSGFEPEHYDTIPGVLMDNKAETGLIVVIHAA